MGFRPHTTLRQDSGQAILFRQKEIVCMDETLLNNSCHYIMRVPNDDLKMQILR